MSIKCKPAYLLFFLLETCAHYQILYLSCLHFNHSNIQAFHGLRNVSEQEDRRFYYFYNENFAETITQESEVRGLGLDAKLTHKVFKTLVWYFRHFQGLTGVNKVHLLTSNA